MHTEDIRCIIRAFLLLWALRWNTWFCERSFRAVLAPPYSPATLRGTAGKSVPPCCRLAAAPSHGPEGPPAFRAHAVGSARDHTAPDRPPGLSNRFENLWSCPSRHGRLESPLAGSCHMHLAAPAIGWRVGRAQDRGGDAASSAAGLWSGPCARQRETLCGAPGRESPCSEARPGGRARLPVGDSGPGAAEPEQHLGPAGPLRPRLPALDVRDRPAGSRAPKPESEARQEVRSPQPVRRPPSGPQTIVLTRRVIQGGVLKAHP